MGHPFDLVPLFRHAYKICNSSVLDVGAFAEAFCFEEFTGSRNALQTPENTASVVIQWLLRSPCLNDDFLYFSAFRMTSLPGYPGTNHQDSTAGSTLLLMRRANTVPDVIQH
jgi:hypothetical protein